MVGQLLDVQYGPCLAEYINAGPNPQHQRGPEDGQGCNQRVAPTGGEAGEPINLGLDFLHEDRQQERGHDPYQAGENGQCR